MADGIVGLLGNARDKIQGLLSNPAVQGAGAAAAFGFNPLLGLLAAPGIKNTRERRASENELLRQEIRSRSRQLDAQDGIRGLLANNVQLPVRQLGLLSPEGGIDMISAPNRRVPEVSTPQGQQRLLGLLADASPDVAAQGLLQQIIPPTRSQTSLVRNLIAAGIDPFSPRGREIIVSNLSGGSTQEQIDLLRAQLDVLNLREKANQIEAGEQEETTFRENLFSSTQTLLDLVQANRSLKGTALQTGQGAGIRRGITQGVGVLADLIGFDQFAGDTLSDANVLEAFDTNASQVVLDAQALESAGVQSNLGLTTRLQSKPSSGKGFVANMVAIANNLQGRMNLFDAIGVTDQELASQGLPTRAQLQSIVDQARSLSVGDGDEISDDDIKLGLGLE